jgi:four helix bundle protein
MSSYKDLLVWQKSIQLVTEVYRLSKTLPKEEIYGLVSQM